MKIGIFLLIFCPDLIKFKDSKKDSIEGCTVLSATAFEIKYELPNKRDKVNYDDVEFIILENKPTLLVDAERLLNEGNTKEAIKKFEATRNSSGINQFVSQYCLRSIADCHIREGDLKKTIESFKKLRQTYPEGYYLFDSYKTSWEVYRTMGSVKDHKKDMEELLRDLKKSGEKVGKLVWKEISDILKGQISELEGKYEEALQIYIKTWIGSDSKEEAIIGKLRCYTHLKKMSDLRNFSQPIIADKTTSVRLKIAAYNARGEVLLSEKKTKDALLSFMWGVVYFNTNPCLEHETSLAQGAICAAKLSVESSDKRVQYQQVADSLFTELRLTYPNSRLISQVQSVLKD